MKIVNARCNNCGSELTYDSDKAMLFCPYCGSKQIIIDGDEVKTAKAKYDAYRDVELAREETEREKNRQEYEREKRIIEKGDNARIELERIKAERKAQREKLNHEKKIAKLNNRRYKQSFMDKLDVGDRSFVLFFGGGILLSIVIIIVTGIVFVHTPESSKKCIGKQYVIVEQQFKDAGFLSVKSEPYGDLSDGWLLKDTDKVGKVKEVSVNGKTDFKKDDEFTRFTPVTIYYHDYPDQQDE